MRYTTLIDVSVIEDLYRNHNAVLLYVHLCLRAGYYDHNRDCYKRSIRGLSYELNMTVSAIRHAIKILERYKLITQRNGVWLVRKYISDQTITPRSKKTSSREEALKREREQHQAALEQQIRDNEANAISYEEYLKQKNEKQ